MYTCQIMVRNLWAYVILMAFVVYVTVAYLLLKYPHLVPHVISSRKHWKHENRFANIVHISHRGKFNWYLLFIYFSTHINTTFTAR